MLLMNEAFTWIIIIYFLGFENIFLPTGTDTDKFYEFALFS